MAAPRILLIEARFYSAITDALVEGALAVLNEAGASVTRIAVPGALEIPAALNFARSGGWDGYVPLGCVIRGETSHYDLVCNECVRGVQDLALKYGLPVGFGVLTVENEAQAWARARRGERDKGGDAARACLDLIVLRRNLSAGAG